MPIQNRKFRGNYHRNDMFDDYNRRMRSPEGMVLGQANITEALLSLGIQAQQMLDDKMDYRRPPKMMKYDQGPSYRGRQQAMGFRGKRVGPGPKKPIDKRKQPIYRCLFCSEPTKNKKGHLQHLKTKKHIDHVLDRQAHLTEKLRVLVLKVQEEARVTERKFSRSTLKFCHVCCVNYSGSKGRHGNSTLHQEYLFMTQMECTDCDLVLNSRFQFEKHLLTLDHIRNRHYQRLKNEQYGVAKDMLEIEDYDPKEAAGYEFIGDVRGYYCQICDELFLSKDMSPLKHSQSEKHYEKFKEYAQKKLAEIEEKKQKNSDQDTEEASKTEPKDEDEPMEEDGDNEVGDGEHAEEEGENVEDEQAEGHEEAENMDEDAENVEDEEVETVDDEVENVDDEVENVDDEVENVDDEVENADDEVENVDDEVENEDEEAENADEEAENVEDDAEDAEGDAVNEEVDQADDEVENATDEELDFEDAQEEATSPQKGKPSPKKGASTTSRPRRSRRSK